jgi:hypothetical protein
VASDMITKAVADYVEATGSSYPPHTSVLLADIAERCATDKEFNHRVWYWYEKGSTLELIGILRELGYVWSGIFFNAHSLLDAAVLRNQYQQRYRRI